MHESWDKFEFRPARTTALERMKKSPYTYNGKGCLHFFSAVLDQILFILAGNDNIHEESLDELEIWLDLTTGFHGNR